MLPTLRFGVLWHYLSSLLNEDSEESRTHDQRRRERTLSPSIRRLEDRRLLAADLGGELFFSVAGQTAAAEVPDVGTVDGADIIRFDGDTFDKFFDGSDVGLTGADINAFDVVDDTTILISFHRPVTLPGVGFVVPSGVVKFTATSTGENTAGTFERFFDAGQHGAPEGADIDGLHLLEDGSLLVSFGGDGQVPGTDAPIAFSDEDIVRFTPDASSDFSSGRWSLHFDGSDVGLGFSTEDTDAVAVDGSGNLLLSTSGSFFTENAGDASGDDEDVVGFAAASLGDDTGGHFGMPLFFNGSDAGVTANLDGIDFQAADPGATNSPPVADPQSVDVDEDRSIVIQLSGDDGDDAADQSLTYEIVDGPSHGTLVDFDPETGTVTYVPDADYHGPDSFTFTVTDDASIDGTALESELATVDINVESVNDVPVNVVPDATQVANEDVATVIEGISVSDVDAGDAPLTVTLAVESGTLNVDPAALGGATVDGNGTSQLTLVGSQQQLNAVFAAGVTYRGHTDFNGVDVLSMETVDAEGARSSTSEVGIQVRSVAEQRDALVADIEQLVEDGVLTDRQGRFLTRSLRFRHPRSVAGRVRSFQFRVKIFDRIGLLDGEQAASLRESARDLLTSHRTTDDASGGGRSCGWRFVSRFGRIHGGRTAVWRVAGCFARCRS